MITLMDGTNFGALVVVQWYRWYIGISYEPVAPGIKAVVLRAGPFALHLISRR